MTQRLQPEPLTLTSSFQNDIAGSFRIAYPLCTATGRDQVALAIEFEKIHRCSVGLTAFASADFEQPHVRWSQAETYQGSHRTVEEFFDGRGFSERGQGGVHGHHYSDRCAFSRLAVSD